MRVLCVYAGRENAYAILFIACFDTLPLHIFICMSYRALNRRNTVFVFL